MVSIARFLDRVLDDKDPSISGDDDLFPLCSVGGGGGSSCSGAGTDGGGGEGRPNVCDSSVSL